MNFKNWTLRFRDDKSWQISSSTKQVLLTKVGPLAKESIAGLASTLLHSVPSGYWQRRTLEKKKCQTWINCENISTCLPCAKVWSWHGFWGSPYSHQTGSCSWPGKKTWCVWHFCIAKYIRTNLNDFAATFWSLSSSKLSRSSKLTIWSSWNQVEWIGKCFFFLSRPLRRCSLPSWHAWCESNHPVRQHTKPRSWPACHQTRASSTLKP